MCHVVGDAVRNIREFQARCKSAMDSLKLFRAVLGLLSCTRSSVTWNAGLECWLGTPLSYSAVSALRSNTYPTIQIRRSGIIAEPTSKEIVQPMTDSAFTRTRAILLHRDVDISISYVN
jgi:hypothetical protein